MRRPRARAAPPGSRPAAIVLFAKVPRPGRVKTRLAPILGPGGALALHGALVADAAAVVRRAARRTGATAVIAWSAPWRPPARGPLRRLAPALGGFAVRPQGSGDLGRRMRHAIREHLERGHEAVVVIGSDAPLLGPAAVARAVRALAAGTPAVVCPAMDGGYCLIGLRSDRPALFRGIRWGTGTVLRATLARLRRARVTPLRLAPARDVDRPADLAWLRRALAGAARRRAPATARFLATLKGAPGPRPPGRRRGHRRAGGGPPREPL